MNASSSDPFILRKRFLWVPFIFLLSVHLLPLLLLWTGTTWSDAGVLFVLYLLEVIGITAGYHRYFSHRAYQTGRVVQFLLAFLGAVSFQRLFPWIAQHRHHHRVSDTERDFHSPIRGFLWSHLWWMFHDRDFIAMEKTIPDITRYPELRFLNRYYLLPALVTATLCYLAGGWSMVIGGFVLSVICMWHVTFSINSLTHIIGKRRYATPDTSKNSFVLALLAFGEGWHNNHHHFSSSARQGFFWWEVDFGFLFLKILSFFGIVWALRSVPSELKGRNLLSEGVVDVAESRVAALRHQLSPRPSLLVCVLTHVFSIAGAATILTLLVVFGALHGSANYIVGVSIFGITLLAHFIFHIWRFGMRRWNFFLLVAGAITPVLVLIGQQYLWAWFALAGVWIAALGLVLFCTLRPNARLLPSFFHVALVLLVALAFAVFYRIADLTPLSSLFLLTTISLFFLAYKWLPALEVLRLKQVFHALVLMGSTSYFFFLHGLLT